MSVIKKIEPNKKCEACGIEAIQWTLTDAFYTSIIYKLCSDCLTDLINCSLSQKQFFNLLNNGHTTMEFLLHDNYYDKNGIAIQPNY